MSGLSYSDQSHKAGLRYLAKGNGSPQDWSVHKSRLRRECSHIGSQGWAFDFPCEHPVIQPGEWYVRTSQGFMETDDLSVECAIRAKVYERK